MSHWKERSTNTFWAVSGTAILVGIAFLVTAFIRGMVWVSETLYPLLAGAAAITLVLCLLVLLPLGCFKKTRGPSAVGLLIASYIFGLKLWALSVLVAFQIWGYVGMLVGLVFLGIGVVPVAYLATVVNGYWSTLGDLFFPTVLTFGTRGLSLLLAQRADADSYPESPDL